MRLLNKLSPRVAGMAAAVVTVVIWTSFIVIARATADPSRHGVLTPFDIALARLLGAGAVLLPVGWWLVRRDRAQKTGASSLFGFSPLSLRVTCTAGLFGGLIYAVLAYSGFVYAPAGHASVLLPGTLPLWTALLALLVLGTRITAARALGLFLILAGGAVVGGGSLVRAFGGGEVWKGDLLFLAAALSWSIYSVLARRYALEAVRATAAITVLAFFVYVPTYVGLLATGLVRGQFLLAPWRDVVFQMLFQGVGSVVISGISFTRMIQYYGPVRSTMITAVVPGLSALAAVVFLGEPMGWSLLIGLLLVTAGIVFGVRAVVPPVVVAKANSVQPARTG
ncbi:MAG: DMT family transporter [Rhodoferax sp.]|nr:DMT family transporter [Rhodoferax sp.]